MATGDRDGLGYRGVDDDPHAEVLVAAMDATARWDATVRLRAWERTHLDLRPGQRLLDVGCGLGEAALGLAWDLGAAGEVVGIDASERMLQSARAAAGKAPGRVRFTLGDARALDEPDGAFDAARCERTLQWLPDPAVAVAELARVVRPGGRISLIDTDWSTFTIDAGDAIVAALVRDGLRTERRRASNVGARLGDLLAAAGCVPLATSQATQSWTAWDPDVSPAPPGCFSMASLADDLVAAGRLAPEERGWFVGTIHDAARGGRLVMRLTMHAVVAAVS